MPPTKQITLDLLRKLRYNLRMDDEIIREKILTQALELAAFDGWNDVMLEQATLQAGFDDSRTWKRVFPSGVLKVLTYYASQADKQMIAAIDKKALSEMRLSEKIPYIVMLRLQQQNSHKLAIKKSVAMLAMPFNVKHNLKSLYNTVDEIWYAAGDQSTDFNFYTKRLSLAKIYSATTLYWLNDDSKDNVNTKEFLDRQIASLLKFHKNKAAIKKNLTKLKCFLPNINRKFST